MAAEWRLMKKFAFSVIATLALMATSLCAADITGKWAAEVTGRNGEKRTQVFNLKADGDKLTGTVVGMGGREMNIEEGKITGDDLSFAVTMEFNGNTRKMEYKGKVVGDEINFKTGQGDRVREFTAKRSTT
jgi:uncharacterized protein (DUF2147 family)